MYPFSFAIYQQYKRISRYFLLLVILANATFAPAQKFFVTSYLSKQGLPSDKVRMVTQDIEGFIWVATDDGLVRFDGKSFLQFPNQIESQYIRAFCHSSDGSILLANDTGIYKLNQKQKEVQFDILIPGGVQSSDTTVHYPNRLFEDSKGRLWISQPNGTIAMWQNGKIKLFPFGKKHTTGYSNSGFSITEAPSGTIWVAAVTGQMYFFNDSEATFQPHQGLEPKASVIHDIRFDDDVLWIIGNGLWKAQTVSANNQSPQGQDAFSTIRYYGTQGIELTSIGFNTSKTNLYLGTINQGLFRAQIQNDNIALQKVFGSNDPHRINQLPFYNINHIFIDKDENIWLSSLQGLGLLQSRFFESVFGLANNNTYVIEPVKKQQVLLSFGDVFEITQDNHEFFGQVLRGIDKGFITAIACQDRGCWMGSANGELFYYRHDQIQQNIDLSNRGGGIFFVETDSRSDTWFCQAPNDTPILGLAKVNAQSELHFYEREKGLMSRILVVKESPRGILYAAGIGPDSYLYRYQTQTDAFINLSLPLPFNYSQNFEVHDITIDHHGLVWLGTTDGLLCYDLERIKRVDLGEYTTSEIRSLVALEDGSIWLATDTKGLIHYQDGAMVHFGEDSGLPTTITSYRSMAKDSQNRIWVGTAEGTVYSHDTMPKPKKTIQPVLLSFSSNEVHQDLPLGKIQLGNNASIEAQFVSLSYPGAAILYQYRLVGSSDSSWSQVHTLDRLRYDKLAFGAYQLEIRAKQAGGYNWSSPLVLPFRVRQVWFKTWWGITLLSSAGIITLFYLFQLNIGRLVNRIRFLEKTLNEQKLEIQEKENLLLQKTEAIQAQLKASTIELGQHQKTIQNNYSNLILLHQLINQIPKNTSWANIITTLKKVASHPIGIDAFEFGFFANKALQLSGYSNRLKSLTQRSKPFDVKNSLAVWVLVHKESILIDDYRMEHIKYIKKQQNYQYQSQVFIPFETAGKQQVVLALYSLKKNTFDQHDLQMLEILTDYIAIAVSGTLELNSWASEI